ncbi:hypothetical protein AVEN_137306-1 [Araneus ventricosus]|uniref:Uncharacterized protein n=1 Tax=Araneus ventricosus TaxID=182803 RepID=A0A4Y2MJJ9_ARAVE|nr:hypothetical protein AVEN_137306-1 [Araneus ventricosus]
MAYFAKSTKDDLKVLAEELGLTVKKEFKVKQLHNLFTESPSYDEEFTLELLAEVEIKCELGHIKIKAAVVTNDPGRYVLGNKTAQLFKDKPLLNLEKLNALTRSQAKRSSEKDRNKEAEMEQPEEMVHIEIDEGILSQADEEYKEIKKLIEVNSKVFIESQHQSRDLAPLLSETKNENSANQMISK